MKMANKFSYGHKNDLRKSLYFLCVTFREELLYIKKNRQKKNCFSKIPQKKLKIPHFSRKNSAIPRFRVILRNFRILVNSAK